MENWLGYLDANDSREKQWLNKPDSFVATRSIRRALDPDRPFVCGRRGAGKSAIAYELRNVREDGSRVFDTYLYIPREDYDVLQNALVGDICTHARLSHSQPRQLEGYFFYIWSYLLDLAMFRCAEQLSERGLIDDTRLAPIKAFLAANSAPGSSPADEARDRTVSCMGEIGSDCGAPITAFSSALKRLKRQPGFPEAHEAAAEAFKQIRGVVAIDTLERYVVDDAYYLEAWRGMCRAIKEFQSSGEHGKLCVKCFLPAELTHHLFSENLAKFNDFAVYLQWSYAELLELLARRYVAFLSELADNTEGSDALKHAIEQSRDRKAETRSSFWRANFWTRFFPERVENAYGWTEDSAAYIIRHTQKRPRELLSCMNSILDRSIEREEGTTVAVTTLISGLHDPDNLHQLLTDNLSIFDLPRQTDGVIAIHEVAADMFANESALFSGKELREFSQRAFSALTRDDRSADELGIEMALRSGLIGSVLLPPREWPATEEGKTCKYYCTQFEYCVPQRVRVNDQSLCAVHPILGDHLHLKDPKGGVVYPVPESDDLVTQLAEHGDA